MAGSLIRAGLPVTLYNHTATRSEPFAAQGAKVAYAPAEAARVAKLILTILSDDNASPETWTGSNGALAEAEPGAVLVESGHR
jgi:3-hydroxyisobutyrate dehydrogenase